MTTTTNNTIANTIALSKTATKQAVLVDVREPVEFLGGHLPGAINLPSTKFQIEDYQPFRHKPIYLICQTGSRARQIAAKFQQQGWQDVFVLEQHMETVTNAHIPAVSTGWSIDRQFRLTLGLMLLVFLLGYSFLSALFIIIPIILCAGLTITAIIDRCYLRVGIAMLPWNRNRGEDAVDNRRPSVIVSQHHEIAPRDMAESYT